MEPIKVKAYGLVNFTKKKYLTVQTLAFIGVIILFAISMMYDLSESRNIVTRNLKVLSIVFFFLEIIETVVMLRKFKAKESEVKNSEKSQ